MTKEEHRERQGRVKTALDKLPPPQARDNATAIRLHPNDYAALIENERFPGSQHGFEGLPIIEDPTCNEGHAQLQRGG